MKKILLLFAFPLFAQIQPIPPTVGNYLGTELGWSSSTTVGAITNQLATVRAGLVGKAIAKTPLCAMHYPMSYGGVDTVWGTATNLNKYTDMIESTTGVSCFTINIEMERAFAAYPQNSYFTTMDTALAHINATGASVTYRFMPGNQFIAYACSYSNTNSLGWCTGSCPSPPAAGTCAFTAGVPAGMTGLTAATQYAIGQVMARTNYASYMTGTFSNINVAHEFTTVEAPRTGVTFAATDWVTYVSQVINTNTGGQTAIVNQACCGSARFAATVLSAGADAISTAPTLAAVSHLWGMGVDWYYPGSVNQAGLACPNATSDGSDMSCVSTWMLGVVQSHPVSDARAAGIRWFSDETSVPRWSFQGTATAPPPGENQAIWADGNPFSQNFGLDQAFWRTIAMVDGTYGAQYAMIYPSTKLIWTQNVPVCQYLTAPSCATFAACDCTNDDLVGSKGAGTYYTGLEGKVTSAVTGSYTIGTQLASMWRYIINNGTLGAW